MCGIAGLISEDSLNGTLLRRMTNSLQHRGPDDRGFWIDAGSNIGLGHRRLSIVDLSRAGREPMHSASGRYVITFNGEIYNYRDIRARLERDALVPEGGWKGHSDIEVLLQAIDARGLNSALSEAVGMFAFALWDRRERTLKLVRDRFGEKPLYYGWVEQDFLFASELKAFWTHPRFRADINRQALRLYVARTCIPAPLSIYRRIFKLPPGCILTLPRDAAAQPLDHPPVEEASGCPQLERYWSYRRVILNGLADPIRHETDALEQLDNTLIRTVADQSVADVPVGMFLSGGIDSSTVAAFYQRTSNQRINTFSIGFEDQRYNEAPFAAEIARRLGTIHHEQIVTERDALDTIPLLPTIYDEPFADSSQIPTYLVSRMARAQVKVALTGDGGDELFGGYHRHFYVPSLWRRVSRIPRPLRMVGVPLSRIPTGFWTRAGGVFPRVGPAHLGAAVQKGLRTAASARKIDDVYASFRDEWSFEESPVLDVQDPIDGWNLELAPGASDEAKIMYCDAISYLPDDILCKVDRASMAVSLETRVPFLDHRVAEVAARIPLSMKMRHGKGKHILRELLYRQAPRELFDRPKSGFGIPVGEWLKGPLRSWAEDLLDPRRMTEEGWLDGRIVRHRWEMHLNGRRDSTPAIWAILMFQAWQRQQAQSYRNAA